MTSAAWWPRRRPPRRDVLCAAGLCAAGVLLFAVGLYDSRIGHPALLLVPLAVAVGADLLRGTAPLLALCVGVAAVTADALLGGSIGTWLVFTDLLYAACLYGPRRVATWLLRGSVLLTVATVVAMLIVLQDQSWRLVIQGSVVLGGLAALTTVVPASTGEVVRHHRDRAAEHREHARQVARLAELDHRAAVAAERARMARELHDLVANHLSAIAIQSTAALRVATDSPELMAETMGVIRENSVQGLAEMRAMIGLLRDTDAAEEPVASPGMAGVPALVDAARRDGLRVDLHPYEVGGPLPASVELAGYRIVQESLTNALKHARPGPAEVRLTRTAEALSVLVSTPLRDAIDAVPGAGAGLVGMRERATLLGGTLTAGPEDGHWVVRACLPLTPRKES
ncbi:sensor histidine kinase [Actinocatenispora rupis]|nr:histidine kinase [Actinocatenispora rupis]